MPQFSLASNSKNTEKLLKDIGLTPHCVNHINEGSLQKKESPIMYVDRMARSISASQDGNTLSVFKGVFVGRRLITLPQTEEEIRYILQLYSGRNHVTHTAVALFQNAKKISTRRTSTRIKIKHLSAQEIDEYISSKEWIGEIGGYDFTRTFQKFIVKITGSPTGAQGLPCYEVSNLLKV